MTLKKHMFPKVQYGEDEDIALEISQPMLADVN